MNIIPVYLVIPLMVLAVAFLPAVTRAGPDDPSGANTLVEGNTVFALDLYTELKAREGNLFFSPYSISTALAMTCAGARGDTEVQMRGVLHFTMGRKALHQAFSRLLEDLNAIQEKGDIALHVANSLWAQKGYVFLEDFLDLIDKNYRAALYQVDFLKATEEARKQINAWVEEHTNNKIQDLIKPGILNTLTRLVLVNAIYFKGDWMNPFDEKLTKEAPFYTAPGKPIPVLTMSQKEKFRYAETGQLQILDMPYAGEKLSMTILLPGQIDGLPSLESTFSPEKLNEWTGLLRRRQVHVLLPKFKLTSQFELGKMLISMGMTNAFSRTADFSGMDGAKDLYIAAVIHKAFVDVNEEGTEAAAASGVAMELTSAPGSPLLFRADHPFLFLIRHNPSGSILFIGRLRNPME